MARRRMTPEQLRTRSATKRLRRLAESVRASEVESQLQDRLQRQRSRNKSVITTRLPGPGTVLAGSGGRASGVPRATSAQPKTSNKAKLATRQRNKTAKLQEREWGPQQKPRLRRKKGFRRAQPSVGGGN